MIYFLIIVPVVGLLFGGVFRTIAASREWSIARSGPAERWVTVVAFILWIVGPFLWVEYGVPFLLDSLGGWIAERAEYDVGNAARIVWALSAIPFVLLGFVIGWGIGTENSAHRAWQKKRHQTNNPFPDDSVSERGEA